MDKDERLRRLEARVVSSDRALQLQAEDLMVAATRRAERTAAWGLLALGGGAVLLVLDVWLTRRHASDVRRVLASGKRSAGESRWGWAPWLIGSHGALWRALPALSVAWRALSSIAAHEERGYRRR